MTVVSIYPPCLAILTLHILIEYFVTLRTSFTMHVVVDLEPQSTNKQTVTKAASVMVTGGHISKCSVTKFRAQAPVLPCRLLDHTLCTAEPVVCFSFQATRKRTLKRCHTICHAHANTRASSLIRRTQCGVRNFAKPHSSQVLSRAGTVRGAG